MRSPRFLVSALACAFLATGCATAVAAPPPVPQAARDAQVSATFVESDGQADANTAVTYDTTAVPAGARVAVASHSAEGSTTVKLAVRGLLPKRQYGAHVHAKPCGPKGDDAGPHFQLNQDPVQPSVDPRYANPQNEIWLDFTTDAAGAASSEAAVGWQIPADRQPHSVVLHADPTATHEGHAGTAGARLGCVSVAF